MSDTCILTNNKNINIKTSCGFYIAVHPELIKNINPCPWCGKRTVVKEGSKDE